MNNLTELLNQKILLLATQIILNKEGRILSKLCSESLVIKFAHLNESAGCAFSRSERRSPRVEIEEEQMSDILKI